MTNTHDEVLLNKLRTKKNTLLCMIQFVGYRCVLVYFMDSENKNKEEHITVYDSICWVQMCSGVCYG